MNIYIYISGKIGEDIISDGTRQKFARAEEMLKVKGYTVINPASEKCQRMLRFSMAREELHGHGNAWKGDFYSFALMTDLVSIWRECDAIYMLEDWDKSPGANAELSFAMATGKKVLWQRLEDAQLNHGDDEAAEDVWLPIG